MTTVEQPDSEQGTEKSKNVDSGQNTISSEQKKPVKKSAPQKSSTPKAASARARKSDKQKEGSGTQKTDSMLAAIQIRGLIGVPQKTKDTLRMLNLQGKNQLIIIPNNQVNKGMLFKCKDYITYGEVDKETVEEIKKKRPTDKKYHALHPPRGGFEKKGIKKSFNLGGALGFRPETKISILIKKML